MKNIFSFVFTTTQGIKISLPTNSVYLCAHTKDNDKCHVYIVGDRVEWIANQSFEQLQRQLDNLIYESNNQTIQS